MGGRYGTGAVVDIEPRVGNVTIESVVGELLDHTAKEVAFTLGVEGPDQGAFEITATRSVAKLDKTLPSVELKDLDGRFSVRVHGSGEFTVDEASGEQEDIVHLHDSEQFVFAERADGTTDVNLRDASGRVLWRDRTTGTASARGYHVSEVSFDGSKRRADVRVSLDTAQPLNEEVIAELSRP